MLRLVVFLAAVLAVRGQTTAVSQCINHAGDLPINTHIEGCITPPCDFPQLSNAVINIVFQTPRTTRSMRTLATAYLTIFGAFPLTVEHDLEDDSWTCNFLSNSYCPVIAGEVLQYELRMYIQPLFFVGVQATVEFRVVDEHQVPIFCIRVPIRVVSPINSPSAKNGTNTITVDLS
ncbi:hypothetical protein K1T71_011440 [Dendrolimus kikuchii]|uniref:Uncharacterized protein n=1 Tax=Dendrolimus kikuchii TaxID=765133 RepID=A0ACC1CNT5_9NEOP|nr:hypothetical protein K1T71_011440 [Dendrolimus kikuchii]